MLRITVSSMPDKIPVVHLVLSYRFRVLCFLRDLLGLLFTSCLLPFLTLRFQLLVIRPMEVDVWHEKEADSKSERCQRSFYQEDDPEASPVCWKNSCAYSISLLACLVAEKGFRRAQDHLSLIAAIVKTIYRNSQHIVDDQSSNGQADGPTKVPSKVTERGHDCHVFAINASLNGDQGRLESVAASNTSKNGVADLLANA